MFNKPFGTTKKSQISSRLPTVVIVCLPLKFSSSTGKSFASRLMLSRVPSTLFQPVSLYNQTDAETCKPSIVVMKFLIRAKYNTTQVVYRARNDYFFASSTLVITTLFCGKIESCTIASTLATTLSTSQRTLS